MTDNDQLAQRVTVRTYFISSGLIHPTSLKQQEQHQFFIKSRSPPVIILQTWEFLATHNESNSFFPIFNFNRPAAERIVPSYLFILLSSLALSFSINSLTETSVPLASVPLFFSCLSLHILTIHYDGSPSPELLTLAPPLVGHYLSSRSSVSSRGCRCWRRHGLVCHYYLHQHPVQDPCLELL
jgi:hypothetical protein